MITLDAHAHQLRIKYRMSYTETGLSGFKTHGSITSIILDSKGKGSLCSIIEHRVPELIPVFGSEPAGDVSHKTSGRLPLLSARPAVTPATLKRAATHFDAR